MYDLWPTSYNSDEVTLVDLEFFVSKICISLLVDVKSIRKGHVISDQTSNCSLTSSTRHRQSVSLINPKFDFSEEEGIGERKVPAHPYFSWHSTRKGSSLTPSPIVGTSWYSESSFPGFPFHSKLFFSNSRSKEEGDGRRHEKERLIKFRKIWMNDFRYLIIGTFPILPQQIQFWFKINKKRGKLLMTYRLYFSVSKTIPGQKSNDVLHTFIVAKSM